MRLILMIRSPEVQETISGRQVQEPQPELL